MSNENGEALRLVDGAGLPIGEPINKKTMDLEVEAKGVFEEMKNMPKDPIAILTSRTRQEQGSMISALMGAYLRMSEHDPCEVEMVMRETEDGSIGFRFRPRDLEQPAQLWAILACHEEEDGKQSFGVVRILAPGVSEEAAHAVARSIQDQIFESGKKAVVYAERVFFAGFPEDLIGAENGTVIEETNTVLGSGAGQENTEGETNGHQASSGDDNGDPPREEARGGSSDLPATDSGSEPERRTQAQDGCCGGSCRPCEPTRDDEAVDPDASPEADEEQARD